MLCILACTMCVQLLWFLLYQCVHIEYIILLMQRIISCIHTLRVLIYINVVGGFKFGRVLHSHCRSHRRVPVVYIQRNEVSD